MTALATNIVTLPGFDQPVNIAAVVKDGRARRTQRILARYDAAQTTDENRKHWANTDSLSARAAASPAVRRVLRVRSRYSVANCPLLKGISVKWADFVVGTGPRLQVKTKVRTFNDWVQGRFNEWAIASKFFHKLWLMPVDKLQSGETVGVFITNPRLKTNDMPVTLDISQVEADQLADPTFDLARDEGTDGVILDDFNNPVGYTILKQHPGDMRITVGFPGDAMTYGAEDVYHWFTPERPGQIRGIPEISSALPLVANRWRYMLSVLAAAETAADHAGVIHTTGTVDDPDDLEPLDPIEIERRYLLTLPKGWDMSQIKAEQPTTTFDMFDMALIKEICRPICMPYAIAAGDSSQSNFASGKLDHLPFWKRIWVEQDRLEDYVVDRVFALWFYEAVRIPGYLPESPTGRATPEHQWFWDGQELLDPREASATDTGLKNGSLTYPKVFAKKGLDLDTEWESDAKAMGMTLAEYKAEIRAQRWPKQPVAAGPAPSNPTADETVQEAA